MKNEGFEDRISDCLYEGKRGKNAFLGVDNVTVYIRTDSEDKFKDIKDAVIKAGIGEHVIFVQVTK